MKPKSFRFSAWPISWRRYVPLFSLLLTRHTISVAPTKPLVLQWSAPAAPGKWPISRAPPLAGRFSFPFPAAPSVPSVYRGRSLFLRFARFVLLFFSTFRYYRFYDHGRKRHIKYDIIFCSSKPTCCSPIPTLQPIYNIGRRRIPCNDDDAPPRV